MLSKNISQGQVATVVSMSLCREYSLPCQSKFWNPCLSLQNTTASSKHLCSSAQLEAVFWSQINPGNPSGFSGIMPTWVKLKFTPQYRRADRCIRHCVMFEGCNGKVLEDKRENPHAVYTEQWKLFKAAPASNILCSPFTRRKMSHDSLDIWVIRLWIVETI